MPMVEGEYDPGACPGFDMPVNQTIDVAGRKYHLEDGPVAAPDAGARMDHR